MKKHRWTAVAVATAMILGLMVITPGATADHDCSLTVDVDDSHAPADTWTQHNHPFFAQTGHCQVSFFEVNPSWGDAFATSSWAYHPTLGSGEYSVQVRAHWSWDHLHSSGFLHCHSTDPWTGACNDWHWHDTSTTHLHFEVTGWMQGPTVKIDITPPTTAISSISGPNVDGTYVTNDTVINIAGSDAHSGVAAVEYRIEDGLWQPAAGGATIQGEDGLYNLSYRTVDNVGLITEQTNQFILDNTGPVSEMMHPRNNSATLGQDRIETCGDEAPADLPEAPDVPGATVGDPCEGRVIEANGQNVTFTPVIVVQDVVDIAVNVTDNLVGTGNVQFIVDGELLEDQPGGDGRFTFTWDTRDYAAGNHNVTLRAFDRLGNQDQIDFEATVISRVAPEVPGLPELP